MASAGTGKKKTFEVNSVVCSGTSRGKRKDRAFDNGRTCELLLLCFNCGVRFGPVVVGGGFRTRPVMIATVKGRSGLPDSNLPIVIRVMWPQ